MEWHIQVDDKGPTAFGKMTLGRMTFSDLYYKPMTIINDDSRIVNKLEASLTDDARVIIYISHMFIVQATTLVYHSM